MFSYVFYGQMDLTQCSSQIWIYRKIQKHILVNEKYLKKILSLTIYAFPPLFV